MWPIDQLYIELGPNHNLVVAGVCCGPCNPSKWEADIWGWLEVKRSAMLHFNERQPPHWACWEYCHTGGTRRWLGAEWWQLCLRDTSRSAKCHRQAAVGQWISLCVKCCRMATEAIWVFVNIWKLYSSRYKGWKDKEVCIQTSENEIFSKVSLLTKPETRNP